MIFFKSVSQVDDKSVVGPVDIFCGRMSLSLSLFLSLSLSLCLSLSLYVEPMTNVWLEQLTYFVEGCHC